MIKRPSTGNLFRPRNREIGLSRPQVGQIMSQRLRSLGHSGGGYRVWQVVHELGIGS